MRDRATVLLIVGLMGLNAPATAQTTTRLNVTSSGAQSAGSIVFVRTGISADGRYVVFESGHPGVVANDTNGTGDVFVLDRQLGTTVRVSVTSTGAEANGFSGSGAISPNGRYVAFFSSARNLDAAATTGVTQVYVHDRMTGATALASLASDGTVPTVGHNLGTARVSDDGRFVAFASAASTLVPGDTNNAVDVFLRDRQLAITRRVSLLSNGSQNPATGGLFVNSVALSGDGRFVAFTIGGAGSGLAPDDTNAATDLYVHDTQTAATTRASIANDGSQVPGIASGDMSADGRYAVFVPFPAQGQSFQTVHVRDRQLGTTTALPLVPGGSPNASVFGTVFSPDGRWILFDANASNLVAGDTNAFTDTFALDRDSGVVTRVSRSTAGQQADQASAARAISNSGVAVFQSDATTLVPGDSNGATDLFTRDIGTGTVARVTVGVGGTQLESVGTSTDAAMSAAGHIVAFFSDATLLVPGDTNRRRDVFIRDRSTNQTTRLPADFSPNGLAVSGDGRYVAIGGLHVRVFDRTTGTSSGVSHVTGSPATLVAGEARALSHDGRYVAFVSAAALEPADTNGVNDVYVHDRVAATTTRVSIASGGTQASASSTLASLSADGRYVAFRSSAANLVPNDTNNRDDIFVHDRQLGSTVRVSVAHDGAQANDSSLLSSISADGRLVAFESSASNLVPNDTNATGDIFVRDLSLDNTTRVNVSSSGGQANALSGDPTISADGRFVAFESFSNNLVAGDTNGQRDAFLHDRVTGETVRISVDSTGAPATGGSGFGSGNAVVSLDGRHVVFQSTHQNLVAGDTNGAQDIFARDLAGPPLTSTLGADWLTAFALPLGSPEAADGADPDGDGVSNKTEFDRGTHPNGTFSRFLAEGSTGFFDARIAVTNPSTVGRVVLVRFLRPGNQPAITQRIDLGPRRRHTVEAATIPGLENTAFATVIEADGPVAVDRTMTWDGATGYGSHAESGTAAPARTWYLAEGATLADLSLFYLLQNPDPTDAATVHVRYLLPSGAPLEKTYVVPPGSRENIWVNVEEFPSGSGNRALASAEVSAVFQVTTGPAIIVERAMYKEVAGQLFGAGHNSAGITTPASTWFLAEGATGAFFDLFVLVANPGARDATVDVTYLLGDGSTISRTHQVPANSRHTIWVDQEDPVFAGAAATGVSTVVHARDGAGIIVERAMWWPGDSSTWFEAHNSPGTTTTGTQWALGEGEIGGPRALSTYVLVANSGTTAGSVRVTLLFEDGSQAQKVVAVPASSRTTIDVGGDPDFSAAFSAAERTAGKRFGTLVESLGATPAPIVVERAMYSDAAGVVWAAGTSAVATKVQ